MVSTCRKIKSTPPLFLHPETGMNPIEFPVSKRLMRKI